MKGLLDYILKSAGYELALSSYSRWKKTVPNGTLYVDIWRQQKKLVSINKWKQELASDGKWIKTSYGELSFDPGSSQAAPKVRDYINNNWGVTLINRQKDWEVLYATLS